MKKPVLVIMAAGMGSRYGGLKQIDPVDAEGHIIMDFSIYDAVRAGFEKVVFIIKKENEADFRSCIGDRMEKRVQVEYVFQDINTLYDLVNLHTVTPKFNMVPAVRAALPLHTRSGSRRSSCLCIHLETSAGRCGSAQHEVSCCRTQARPPRSLPAACPG